MSLAQRAASGVLWTAAERVGVQALQFVVLVVLARLLSPADFGLVAMLMVVFGVSSALVNGGFAAALIREPEITEEDKSTAFWMNVATSLVLYVCIWFAAPAIAAFFEQPELTGLTRFMALNLVFLALTLVQQAELSHGFAFRKLGLLSIAASVVTGAASITLALLGFGAWALAAKYVLFTATNTVLLYWAHPWLPRRFFDRGSFEKLFGFGWKLAASGVLNEAFLHVYKVVIGKFFAAATLGFYTQAQNFQNVASRSFSEVLQKVTYPILSRARDEPRRLKHGYRKMIRTSSFVVFPVMIGIAVTARPLVLAVLGERWLAMVPFLQLLCVSGALHHLHTINLTILKVVGRTDLFLKIEVIKKLNIAVAILVGLQFGLWGLLVGQVVAAYVALFVNMLFTRRFIDYSIPEQLRDIASVLWLSVPMAAAAVAVDLLLPAAPVLELAAMATVGALVYLLTSVLAEADPLRTIVDLLEPRFGWLRRLIHRSDPDTGGELPGAVSPPQ